MAKWIHTYIKENNVMWERERLERIEERRKKMEDWERKTRCEKIIILKEKFKENQREKEETEKGEEIDKELLEIAERGERNWTVWRKEKKEIDEGEETEKTPHSS